MSPTATADTCYVSTTVTDTISTQATGISTNAIMAVATAANTTTVTTTSNQLRIRLS